MYSKKFLLKKTGHTEVSHRHKQTKSPRKTDYGGIFFIPSIKGSKTDVYLKFPPLPLFTGLQVKWPPESRPGGPLYP
jgi:hypothetical protein